MIPIDMDLHQELKVYCVNNHLIMKRIVEDLIKDKLEQVKKGAEAPSNN